MGTRSGRRKRRGSEKGELYQIVEGDIVLAEKTLPSEGAALSIAQNLIIRRDSGEEDIHYTVRLKPVLGPPDNLYHLVLTPKGHVLTWPDGALRERPRT
jgi:hypothetical protein